MIATMRDMVGGPFDGECHAVDECAVSVTVRISHSHQREADKPEWSKYVLGADDRMHYVGRYGDCLDLALAGLHP